MGKGDHKSFHRCSLPALVDPMGFEPTLMPLERASQITSLVFYPVKLQVVISSGFIPPTGDVS